MNEPNEKVKNLCSEILSSQDLPKDKFGSILMILMMAAILVNVIRVLQECGYMANCDKTEFYKNKIIDLSKRKGWFTKMRLKRILRKELSKEDYKLYSKSLMNAMLKKGEHITDEETLALLEIANV